jgi:RNA polymerase sigma-70 factor (ECF subfamily)
MPPSTDQTSPRALELSRWFADEVQPHVAPLRSYLRGAFPRVRDVDDVVQESFLQLWRARAAAPVVSGRAFLFVVAQRIALKILRKDRNAPFAPVADAVAAAVPDARPDAFAALAERERIDLLADALMTLPPRCREVFFLRKIAGVSQREVAGRLGLSERTVEAHVRAGTARCCAYFNERGLTSLHGDES